MGSNVIIAVLVIIVLLLAYYAWAKKCEVAKIEGELGNEVADLEVLLAEVEAEHFQDLGTGDVAERQMSRRDRIEAAVRRIQALKDAGKIKLDKEQEARLRRAVARADDYLVETTTDVSQDAAMMIRRLRDALLVIAAKGRFQFCDQSKKRNAQLIEIAKKFGTLTPEEKTRALTMQSPDSLQGLIMPLLGGSSERPEVSKEVPVVPTQPALPTAPVVPTQPEHPGKERYQDASPVDNERMALMRMYVGLNQAICAPELRKMINEKRDKLKAFAEEKLKQDIPLTKEELLEISDAMEPLMLHVQKKMCPDGKLDNAKVAQVYTRFMDVLCTDEEIMGDLVAKPLNAVITKTIAMFA